MEGLRLDGIDYDIQSLLLEEEEEETIVPLRRLHKRIRTSEFRLTRNVMVKLFIEWLQY